jgi:DNA modification methylase
MQTWPDEFIDCCITSPPYWGLRDYGVDGQLGLEKTPEEYVAKMVKVFAEVKRVLKPEGTLFLNLGDSYAASSKGTGGASDKQDSNTGSRYDPKKFDLGRCGLKPKDLVGIPWMVAFALRQDGWFLRQDIIWHKPNPMPESVRDRCTKAHEYIFLLSKQGKYYCDMEAVKEPQAPSGLSRAKYSRSGNKKNIQDGYVNCVNPNTDEETRRKEMLNLGRNKRSVWTVTTKPYSEAHFATFPPDLITPCVLAGCPEDGLVLDPFMGSGTTAMVAYENRRNYIGCELNPEYIELNRAEKSKDKYALLEM